MRKEKGKETERRKKGKRREKRKRGRKEGKGKEEVVGEREREMKIPSCTHPVFDRTKSRSGRELKSTLSPLKSLRSPE